MVRSISVLFILFFLVTAAQAQDPAAHGQALVAEFCGGCHAVGVKGKSKHPDAPPFRVLGRTVDLDEFPRVLERGISGGHPDMASRSPPAIRDIRTSSEVVCIAGQSAHVWVARRGAQVQAKSRKFAHLPAPG